MKNFVKGFLVATLVFAVTLTGFAASKKQSIEVELNPANIVAEGEEVDVDHFIYKGTTYVPVRALAETLGVEVHWDDESKTINLYRFEPRAFGVYSFAGLPLDEGISRNSEYDRALKEIQEDIISLINHLNRINLAENPVDNIDTFLELWDRRALIENKLYSTSFDVNYRVPIFYTLEALDCIEIALATANSLELTPEDSRIIKLNLDRAMENAEFIMFLGF